MASSHLGNWLVYINGIQVPANRVDIRYGILQHPEAEIVMAPDRELLRFGSEDRVPVAVFYLDDVYVLSGKNPEYRLLFEGEIVSWGYSNSTGERNISFHAVAQTTIFDQLFTFFMTNVDGFAQGRTKTGDTAAFAQSTLFPSQFFFQRDDQNRSTSKFITRPYDFVENIFISMLGDTQFDQYNSSVAAHFFARWIRRNNFLNRWAPSPFVEDRDLTAASDGTFPILRAYQTSQALEALRKQAADGNYKNSMWGLITDTFRSVYYEMTMLPTMPVVAYDLVNKQILGKPKFAAVTPAVKHATDALTAAQQSLQVINQQIAANPSSADLTAARTQAQAAIAGFTTELNTAKAAAVTTSPGLGPADPKFPVRLINYVTKPQLHYTVPPKCNIILPSMTQAYSFTENYANQPTRMYIGEAGRYQGMPQGSGAVGTLAAANATAAFPDRVQQYLDSSGKNLQLTGKNFLIYPEEFFKGPVIDNLTAPDWFFHLSNSIANQEVLKAQAQGVPSTGIASQTLKRVKALYAEFEYTKERGSQKYGSLALRFNPYVAPGFPTVIFDNPDTGVHVFGYMMNVSHSLTSSSMTTSVNYSYAQTFDEFFQTLIEQKENFHGRVRDDSALDMAPALPVPELQSRFQVIANANDYYLKLFHQGDATTITVKDKTITSPTVFSWQDSLGIVDPTNPNGEPTPISLIINSSTTVSTYDGNTATQRLITTNAIQDLPSAYQLRGTLRSIAGNSDLSMQYVSRPICTLDEYINFNGDYGVRVSPVTLPNTHATYYEQILDFVPGPGQEPVEDADGNRSPAMLEDTRRDWTTRLQNYKIKMKAKLNFKA